MNGDLQDKNIVLIGMPGVGKSTIGVLLAKLTSRSFIDTDVYIQVQEMRTLQDLLDREGRAAFCRLEEKHILSMTFRNHVIATGGSVVYSERAMNHLKSGGAVVHLDMPIDEIEKRLRNLDVRGVVMEPGQNRRALFAERDPLYKKYADITVDCTGLNHERVVERILAGLHPR